MFELAFSVLIKSLVFAVVYYFMRGSFTGIATFQDALLYSIRLSTTVGSATIHPVDDVAKGLVSSHVMLSFASLYNTVFLRQSSVMFFVANAATVALMTCLYVFAFERGVGDSLYHAAMTNTLSGGARGFATPMEKAATAIHMLLVFALVFNGPKNGVYDAIMGVFLRKGGRDPMYAAYYK